MDHERTARMIGRIYEAAMTPAGWAPVLEDPADLARGEAAWMVISAPRLGLNTVVAPRSDPEVIAEYQRFWWSRDPTLAVTHRAPVGLVTSLGDTGRACFLGSEFHNDFWRRSGHATERLAANLACEGDAFVSLGVQPSRLRDSIDARLARVFRLLVPHAVRSIEIGCGLRRLELERSLPRRSGGPGTLLVDRACRVIVADEAAERILAGNPAIGVAGGSVEVRPAGAGERLRRLVASCREAPPGPGPMGGVVRVAGGPGLMVRVFPFIEAARPLGPEVVSHAAPAAMLVLREPARERGRAAETLRRAFGLTPAEAGVALELARAEGRAAAAARLGVTLATVRTHMMRIFSKAGVRSQAGLLAAMARAGIDVAGPASGDDDEV